MTEASTVHIVHCIDTEGPLHESVEATFERLREIFQLDLEPSARLLSDLQAGRVSLGGCEAAVQKVIAPTLLAYNDTWDKVDRMLERLLSEPFRNAMLDSAGSGWVYNWFCVDHVDYDANPRRRDVGYHNVFSHYRRLLKETDSGQDGLHFHYHPHAFSREAHRSATHWWANSDSLFQVLSRRVIDHGWFPAAHRAGFHVTRPDSHWFLEQYIPFDFSNQSAAATTEDSAQFGVADGRFGDWRRAPATWAPYHPSPADYQTPGSCRRWIARCLNVGTRYRLIEEQDVRQAFREATEGQPVVLAVTNHDFRDMTPDVERVRALVARVAPEFPDVRFRFSEAISAMREALGFAAGLPCVFNLRLRRVNDKRYVLEVSSDTPSFGPQPWLALRTVAGRYHFDNFDIDRPFYAWRYVLDEDTFPLAALTHVGVAANTATGVTTVSVLDARTEVVTTHHWNN